MQFNKLNQLPQDFMTTFMANQRHFRDNLYRNIPDGWKKSGGRWAIINKTLILTDDVTIMDVHNWTRENFCIAYNLIQKYFEYNVSNI